MQYIDFKVQHQTITRTDNYEVVGNSRNYLYARFGFCAEWEGLTQTAVFSTNSGKHYSALIEDGMCPVPWEVLQSAEFWVGVFAGERVTTSTVRVPVKPSVKIGASPGMAPSPTAYETLVANAAASAEAAETARAAAETSRVASALSEKNAESAACRAEAALDSIVLSGEELERAVTETTASAKAAKLSENAAAESAEAAEDAANRAQAEAERVGVPAAVGVYNVILTDRVTAEKYALIVESGRLSLLGVSEALDSAEVNLVDNSTGTAYKVAVESGRILLEEV